MECACHQRRTEMGWQHHGMDCWHAKKSSHSHCYWVCLDIHLFCCYFYRTQVSLVRSLCPDVRPSVSEWVSAWQGHLLSCSGQLKTSKTATPNFETVLQKNFFFAFSASDVFFGAKLSSLPINVHNTPSNFKHAFDSWRSNISIC